MSNEALQKAIQGLSIRSVGLVEAEVKSSRERWGDPNSFESLQIENRQRPTGYTAAELKAEGHPVEKVYRFFFELGFRMLEVKVDEEVQDADRKTQTGEEAVIGSVDAVFFAEYTVTENEWLDEDSVNAFGPINALYHIWPYWREYVSSSLNRMRLPNFQVPMFRLPTENLREDQNTTR